MKSRPLLLALALWVIPACYGSPDVTYHEPHEYKGKTDPLLALEQSTAQQETLKKRFERVQADR